MGPNCRQCRHFHITWDKSMPYGCRKFAIKTRDMPSQIVRSAGQGDCQQFEAKTDKKANGDKKLDLNDPSLW